MFVGTFVLIKFITFKGSFPVVEMIIPLKERPICSCSASFLTNENIFSLMRNYQIYYSSLGLETDYPVVEINFPTNGNKYCYA